MIVIPYGYKQLTFDISSTAQMLTDVGFTEEEVYDAEIMHINVYGNDLIYTYTADVVLTTANGHLIPEDGERIIKGIRSVRNFAMISRSGTATCTVTLSKF
jgi:hypothetical protein